MINKIKIEDKIKEIDNRPYYPVEVARTNDQVIRIALFDGEFHWHKHKNEDEFFYIYNGKIKIQFKDQEDIILSKGEMTVIPKGVEHCPKSIEPSYVLLSEPYQVDTKGDAL